MTSTRRLLKELLAQELRKKKEDLSRIKPYKKQWQNIYTYVSTKFLKNNLKQSLDMADTVGAVVIEKYNTPRSVIMNFRLYRTLVNMNGLMEKALKEHKIGVEKITKEMAKLEESDMFYQSDDEMNEVENFLNKARLSAQFDKQEDWSGDVLL